MLKKVFVFLSAIVIVVSFFLVGNLPIFKDYSNSHEIYLSSSSNSKNIVTKIGHSPFIFAKKGESVCIEKQTFDLHSFLLQMKAKVVFSEEINGKTSYYAYSPSLKYIQQIKNRNVNLHIVIGEESVKVGSPIIYGSF